MAEFDFGLPPRGSNRSLGERAQSIWEWFITPDGEGSLLPPTVSQAIGEQLEDTLAGRSGNNAGETKLEQKAIEKVVRGGPLGESIVEVLFGDNRAGAPDPSSRRSEPFIDEQGQLVQFNERGEKLLVQMLPIWLRDP
jgi:hypothetical protein